MQFNFKFQHSKIQIRQHSKSKDVAHFDQITKVTNSNQQENTLRNTFGWTRIDILTMLIVCIFLAAFCFSLLVEAVQTLFHIHHQDAMHYPLYVLITGAIGFVLNGLCYLLIGGYTFHQGSFLHITSNGDVVLDRVATNDAVRQGERRLSRTKQQNGVYPEPIRRQSALECFRDMCSEYLKCFNYSYTTLLFITTKTNSVC